MSKMLHKHACIIEIFVKAIFGTKCIPHLIYKTGVTPKPSKISR